MFEAVNFAKPVRNSDPLSNNDLPLAIAATLGAAA